MRVERELDTAQRWSFDQGFVTAIAAALARDRPLGGSLAPLRMCCVNKELHLSGELHSLETKRRIAHVLTSVTSGSVRISDALQLRPLIRMSDEELLLCTLTDLRADTLLQRCHLSSAHASVPIAAAGDDERPEGHIHVSVNQRIVRLDGVVPALHHKLVAEARAYWALGTCRVDNALAISGRPAPSDEALRQALLHILLHEPLLRECTIGVRVRDGAATLTGSVSSRAVREVAEFDAWLVPGIGELTNLLAVAD
jgi:osmotically-inducible protein OsmY